MMPYKIETPEEIIAFAKRHLEINDYETILRKAAQLNALQEMLYFGYRDFPNDGNLRMMRAVSDAFMTLWPYLRIGNQFAFNLHWENILSPEDQPNVKI